ncbi:MAG: phenylalanine--tRNA ligase beta subunit-related protein [Bacillota bacterium]
MKFIIDPLVFDVLPTVCFGVVVAKGVDNHGKTAEINALLREAMAGVREKYAGVNLKEHPAFVCYREAFKKLGFNPNKFLSSVEALVSRVVKGGELPEINDVVNLVNAVSLKYTLPMGAHDLDSMAGDIMVRFSKEGEQFVPFGRTEPETVPAGELVYANEKQIRTRRWIWRQNERGKVTAESKNVFFPIDGFSDCNLDSVLRAQKELAGYLERFWGVRPEQFFLDKSNYSTEW